MCESSPNDDEATFSDLDRLYSTIAYLTNESRKSKLKVKHTELKTIKEEALLASTYELQERSSTLVEKPEEENSLLKLQVEELM